MATHERIKFRVFSMPCCGFNLCWVNPRLPTYCPECGSIVYKQLRFNGEPHILLADDNAVLEYSQTGKD